MSLTLLYVDLGLSARLSLSESCDLDTSKVSATRFTANPRPVTMATARSVFFRARVLRPPAKSRSLTSSCPGLAAAHGLASATTRSPPSTPPRRPPGSPLSRLRSCAASNQRSDWGLYHDGGPHRKSSFRAGPLPAQTPSSVPLCTAGGAGYRQTLRLDQHC